MKVLKIYAIPAKDFMTIQGMRISVFVLNMCVILLTINK